MAFTPSADSIIQVISAVIIAIVSVAAAFIAARYTEKYRDQSENRTEHYRQIKANVLNPMLKQTDQYYLPILEFKKENLHWDRRDTKRFAVALNEEPTTYEVVASIVSPNTSGSQLQQQDEQAHVEKELSEDCAKNHFKTLFERWKGLTSRANEFNKESLDIANSITESVAKTLGLPVVNDWDSAGECVYPYCGVAIFNRMAGTGGFQLTTGIQDRGHGKHEEVSFGNPIVQLNPSSDVQKARNAIDGEIKERREKFLQLKTKAESIVKEFVPFRAELATLTEKQKLSGKCDYV